LGVSSSSSWAAALTPLASSDDGDDDVDVEKNYGTILYSGAAASDTATALWFFAEDGSGREL
jgi:hypothetical protein